MHGDVRRGVDGGDGSVIPRRRRADARVFGGFGTRRVSSCLRAAQQTPTILVRSLAHHHSRRGIFARGCDRP